MKYRKRKEHVFQHTADNLRLVSMTAEQRKALLEQHSTAAWAASPNIYFVEFSCLNRAFRGYGIKNSNGGVEFINSDYMEVPVTLKNNGFVIIYQKEGEVSKNCCLFYDFVDYLSFYTIQKLNFFQMSEGYDCFIMSNVKNFISMVVETDDYDNIYMFFPNDVVGTTISQTIENRNKRHVHNCGILYRASPNFHQFASDYIDMVNKINRQA